MDFETKIMFEACRDGDIEKVNELMEKRTTEWMTGLCCACENGHLEIVRLIMRNMSDIPSHWGNNKVLNIMRKVDPVMTCDILSRSKYGDLCVFYECVEDSLKLGKNLNWEKLMTNARLSEKCGVETLCRMYEYEYEYDTNRHL